MDFRLMGRMLVLVRAMLPGVLMVVDMGVNAVAVLMGMLVQMLMGMRMRVLMQMGFLPMLVLMAVIMGMVVGVQMLMFMFAFHDGSPFFKSPQSPKLHQFTGSKRNHIPGLPASLFGLPELTDMPHQVGTGLESGFPGLPA